MPAYIIFIRERVKDPDEVEKYRKLAPAAMKGRDMKPLAVYGNLETLEGPEAQGVVLLEFPTYDEAVSWYDSEEYKKARIHRFLGADYRTIVVQGV